MRLQRGRSIVVASALALLPDDGKVPAGATLRYRDNGDGTITDLNTGLMWEKKDTAGGLHDKDNTYVWSGNGSQEAIWDWLDDVNAEGGTGFASHKDWRIPTVKELQGIVDYQSNPSIDSVFGDTVPCIYWSSFADASVPASAWGVFFGGGDVISIERSCGFFVRAVRAGWL